MRNDDVGSNRMRNNDMRNSNMRNTSGGWCTASSRWHWGQSSPAGNLAACWSARWSWTLEAAPGPEGGGLGVGCAGAGLLGGKSPTGGG